MKAQNGKIEPHFFKQFIQCKCGKDRQEVRIKPQFGVDVSVIDLNPHQSLAVASDPISLIPSLGLQESAWLSVQLTANDIATTGYAPLFGQFILNLPKSLSATDFQTYWEAIHRYCDDIGIAITGGHTSFIEGQHTTTPGGATFMTLGEKNNILTSTQAEPGDVLLVTKTCAISSSAILAMSFPETVKNKVGLEYYLHALESFYKLSCLKDALQAVNSTENGVTAMHDVTEGGVLGAIYEMAIASNNGAIIYDQQLPIHEAQSAVCEVFSLDPRRCIGAGSLIIACKKEAVEKIKSSLKKEEIPCVEVGNITPQREGIRLIEGHHKSPLIYHQKDPYWNAFFKAIKSGWK